MFRFIGNFLRTTFGIVGMVMLFLLSCLVGYGIYWFLEFFFMGAVEHEWITNKYIVPVLTWIFEGDYSDIIEIIMVVGFGVLYILGQGNQRNDYA